MEGKKKSHQLPYNFQCCFLNKVLENAQGFLPTSPFLWQILPHLVFLVTVLKLKTKSYTPSAIKPWRKAVLLLTQRLLCSNNHVAGSVTQPANQLNCSVLLFILPNTNNETFKSPSLSNANKNEQTKQLPVLRFSSYYYPRLGLGDHSFSTQAQVPDRQSTWCNHC